VVLIMPIAAQPIIRRAQIDLQDPDGVRWPASELVDALNQGQRAIVMARPDQTARYQDMALAAGVRQALPAEFAALIDVPRNAGGRRRTITKVDQLMLDQCAPDWQGLQAVLEVEHFMHDLREPRTFLVYPPVRQGVQVQITASAYPTDVPAPGGAASSTVTGSIGLPDQWERALLHYVMFRALSKDAEFGGNAAQATAHYGLFTAELGTQLQSTSTVAPTS
jgi:hypothetical protein